MATLVSPQLRSVADVVVKKCGLASAVLSGIVPDGRHLDSGGYHCSVEDLKRFGNGGDYSNVRVDDKNFNIKYGAAFDVTMSTADMKKVYNRVCRVWKDQSDPRRKYINAINCWDGSGDAVRLDFKANKAKFASADHKWHVHGDMPRRYLLDAKAARAWISVFAGEGKATWLAREESPLSSAKPVAVVTPVPTRPAAKPVAHVPGIRLLSYTPGRMVLRGEDVVFVQRFIGPAKAGPADGVFGARSRAAVRWYQGMRGLRVDGAVGGATWRALGVKSGL